MDFQNFQKSRGKIFENSIIHNHSMGSSRSHKKFGPDRFNRFDVYWIQKNEQTDKQSILIEDIY